MAYSAAELEMVDRHIVQGERHVTQQEKLVQRLKDHGLPTGEAEKLLDDFRSMLVQHREHRDIMFHGYPSDGF